MNPTFSFLSFFFVIVCLAATDLPPEELRFRLVNKVYGLALYPSGAEGYLSAAPPNQIHPYLMWNVVALNDNDYFRVMHEMTGSVMYSNSNGRFGVKAPDSNEDNYWEIDSPTSDGYFRLVNKQSGNLIYSPGDSRVGHRLAAQAPVHDNQFWQFAYEDFDIVSMSFDYDEGVITERPPMVISSIHNHNEGGEEPSTITFNVDETVKESTHFSHTHGVSLTVGTTFKTGVPFIVDGKIKTSLTASYDFEWGSAREVSQSYTASFEIVAGKGEHIYAEATVSRGNLDVPYTMKMKVRDRNAYFYSSGMWYGVTTWSLRLHKTCLNCATSYNAFN